MAREDAAIYFAGIASGSEQAVTPSKFVAYRLSRLAANRYRVIGGLQL
jgi:hypothetical protein